MFRKHTTQHNTLSEQSIADKLYSDLYQQHSEGMASQMSLQSYARNVANLYVTKASTNPALAAELQAYSASGSKLTMQGSTEMKKIHTVVEKEADGRQWGSQLTK